jgi:23S rRNA pseudouridine1911/1915/1917 synthase
MNDIIIVKNDNSRLDKFLAAYDQSETDKMNRSQLQKIIKDKRVLVNGFPAKANCRLKDGDSIKILPKYDESGQNRQEIVPSKFVLDDILVENNKDFLVINKPAGILVHGSSHLNDLTLADLLEKKYPQLRKVGDDPFRPGIVHRLDKNVSGLLVVAKNQASFDALKEQFKKRLVDKRYLALVFGHFSVENGEVNFPIARSAKGYKMAALPESVKGEKNASGRRAITQYRVLKKYVNYSLLEIAIKTGRTHQIRVHMSALSHPIVGDNTYATKKHQEKNRRLVLGRIFLVSKYLAFADMSGNLQKYEIGLPDDLKNFLKKLKHK